MSAVLVEMSQQQTAAAEWKLYYWYTPDSPLGVFPGRGEYVRMMFEEAGVAYEDVCRKKNSNDDLLGFMKGEKEGFPVQAPPIIQRGDLVMSQTPAIMVYLGKKFGLAPEAGPEEEAHAWQLLLSIHDYHFEGNMSCHPVDLHATAAIQMEEAKVTQKKFCETRMAKFLKVFERILSRSNDGKGFLIGSKVTYVDIAMLTVLLATETQFPEAWAAQEVPLLKAFMKRMEERPNISAYRSSDRCLPFSGYSMM